LERHRDVVASAIGEREAQHHLFAVLGERYCVFQSRPRRIRQLFEFAHYREPDTSLRELVLLLLRKLCEQPHQGLDFELWALPVGDVKRVKGPVTDALATASALRFPDCVGALGMAVGPQLAARLGPTSVAVHDDGYVMGY